MCASHFTFSDNGISFKTNDMANAYNILSISEHTFWLTYLSIIKKSHYKPTKKLFFVLYLVEFRMEQWHWSPLKYIHKMFSFFSYWWNEASILPIKSLLFKKHSINIHLYLLSHVMNSSTISINIHELLYYRLHKSFFLLISFHYYLMVFLIAQGISYTLWCLSSLAQ